MYIYIYIYTHTYIYNYIYIEIYRLPRNKYYLVTRSINMPLLDPVNYWVLFIQQRLDLPVAGVVLFGAGLAGTVSYYNSNNNYYTEKKQQP